MLELETDERARLLRLCQTARETGYPPVLTPDEMRMLNRYGSWTRVLEAMGIPALKGADARYMAGYWAQQRGETDSNNTRRKSNETMEKKRA